MQGSTLCLGGFWASLAKCQLLKKGIKTHCLCQTGAYQNTNNGAHPTVSDSAGLWWSLRNHIPNMLSQVMLVQGLYLETHYFILLVRIPDVPAGFIKGRRIRDQIANICWVIKKQEFQKNIYFCFIDYVKAFYCMDHNKLENSSRDGTTRPPYLSSEKSACRSRSKS